MSYVDSLTIVGEVDVYSIGLINETQYNPDSSDNVLAYSKFYSDRPYSDYSWPTLHGILALVNETIVNSACICSSGGPTGIHAHCSILENSRLLICCSSRVFCLSIPNLELLWVTVADSATCFEIFKFEDSYIIHGELEISSLGMDGKIPWKFAGSDIFTTPTGKEDFKLIGSMIEATNWDAVKYRLDARSGREL